MREKRKDIKKPRTVVRVSVITKVEPDKFTNNLGGKHVVIKSYVRLK